MTRWHRWSERVDGFVVVSVVLCVGAFAEWVSDGFRDTDVWLPDLAVGVVLAVVGTRLRAANAARTARLMEVAALVWFFGNFADSSVAWVAWSASHLALLHRALVVHAVVAFSAGRRRGWAYRIAVAALYGGDLVTARTRSESLTIWWTVAVFVVYVLLVHASPSAVKGAGYHVLPVVAVFSAVEIIVEALLLVMGDAPAPLVAISTYQLGMVLTAALLLVRTIEWNRRSRRIADAVVEITLGPTGDVREMMSRALRDHTVAIAFAVTLGDLTLWVDEAGRRVAPLSAGESSVVSISVEGQLLAQVASKVDLESSPTLLSAVQSATRLAAKHASLRSNVRAEIDLLDASRLRLLTAADRQRVRLADQLASETGATLSTLRAILDGIVIGDDQAVDEAWNRSIARLEGLESDLRSLAAGLGPMLLVDGGLRRALQQLADEASAEVEIVLDEEIVERLDQLAPAVARTIYFVCAEGIANALKHASARKIEIKIASHGSDCTVEVADDGRGGADGTMGSGLQGIEDRVAAVGGTLTVRSPVWCGTRLTAELPIGSSAVTQDSALQVADPSPRSSERH